MSTINALLKKRERLEQQIAAAQSLEKRKIEVVNLLEKHGLLDLPDAEILRRLQGPAGPATPLTATGELE